MTGRIITNDFRLFNAREFIEALDEGADDQSSERTRLYFYIGKPIPFNSVLEYIVSSSYSDSDEIPDTLTGESGETIAVRKDYSGFGKLYLEDANSATPRAIGSEIATNILAGKFYYDNPTMPVNPPNNEDTIKKVFDNMLALKRVKKNYLRVTTRKFNYVNGEIYNAWNGNYTDDSNNQQSNYYVYNSNYEVFMCIKSGDGNSTIEPTSMSGDYNEVSKLFSGSDGYVWRHMYTVMGQDFKFSNSDYIPISNMLQLQENPYKGVSQVNIVYEGAGLREGTFYLKASNNSAKSGGSNPYEIPIKVDISSGVVTSAEVANFESQTPPTEDLNYMQVGNKWYNDAAASTETSGTETPDKQDGAKPPILEVVVPPIGGYGSDVASQLRATNLQFYISMGNGDNEVDFPVDVCYSQVGLIMNPESTSDTKTYADEDTLSASHAFKLSSGMFDVNAIIRQGEGDNKAIGIVVECIQDDSGTGSVLKYIQPSDLSAIRKQDGSIVTNKFNNSDTIYEGRSGDTTDNNATIDSNYTMSFRGLTFTNGVAEPEIKYCTGDVINVGNRRQVKRNADQTENIAISIAY